MWDRLRVTTPPDAQPVSLVDAKAQCRVETASQDALIGLYLEAATAQIDGPHGIGMALMPQVVQLSVDCFTDPIHMPLYPVRDIAAITYLDTDGALQTLAAENYDVHIFATSALVQPAHGVSWPATRVVTNAVNISFNAGYVAAASVPADLRHAILMTVAHWYANRESVVVGTITSKLPHAVENILRRYRVGLAS